MAASLTNRAVDGQVFGKEILLAMWGQRKTIDVAVVTPLQPELLTNKYLEGNYYY